MQHENTVAVLLHMKYKIVLMVPAKSVALQRMQKRKTGFTWGFLLNINLSLNPAWIIHEMAKSLLLYACCLQYPGVLYLLENEKSWKGFLLLALTATCSLAEV